MFGLFQKHKDDMPFPSRDAFESAVDELTTGAISIKFTMRNYSIVEYKGGNALFDNDSHFNTKGYLVAKATVNGVQNVIIGTPACHKDYCQRDIDFVKGWGKVNPQEYYKQMKQKDWAGELVKALEKG